MPQNPTSKLQTSYRGFVQFTVLGGDFLLLKPSFFQPFFLWVNTHQLSDLQYEFPHDWVKQTPVVNPTADQDIDQLSEWFKGDQTLAQLLNDFGGGAIKAFLDLIEKMEVKDVKAAFPQQGFQAQITLSIIFKDRDGQGIGYEDWIRIKEFELKVIQSAGGFSEKDWEEMEHKALEDWKQAKEEQDLLAIASRL